MDIVVTQYESGMSKDYVLVHKNTKCEASRVIPLFDGFNSEGENLIVGKPNEGRGNAAFIHFENDRLLTKHYKRGGLIAKLSSDRYFWLGLNKTRAFKELKILGEMLTLGLPVPKPFAARIKQSGFTYSEDIITYEIQGVESLGEISKKNSHERWGSVGELIKKFHKHNIYHADLNAHNILLGDNDAYLIDFDRGKKCKGVLNYWKKSNLKRLYKSLVKLRRLEGIHFTQDNWQSLLQGYNQLS